MTVITEVTQLPAIDIATAPVAIVSGGSRGLGFAIVEDLLLKGYRVATFSRKANANIDNLNSLDPNNERFIWQAADATDTKSVTTFVKSVVRQFGPIQVLVNNAGIGIEGLLTMMSDDEIDNGIALNLSSAIYLTRITLKSMLSGKQGCIINISSVNGVKGHKGLSVYSATKSALNGLTISLAREYGSQNIRINTISPGFFESDMSEHLSDGQIDTIKRRTALKRLCTIDDLVKTVDFLISNNSITGQNIVVDSGFSC